MLSKLVHITLAKIDVRTGEEGPKTEIGFLTRQDCVERYPHEYFLESGTEWRVYEHLVDVFVYNKVYAQILPGGPFVTIAGSTHDAFLKALLDKLRPQCAALKNVMMLYKAVAGSQYERELYTILMDHVGGLTPFDKDYLKHFLLKVVGTLLSEDGVVVASQEAETKRKIAH